MPIITILSGFKFTWDAIGEQGEVDELKNAVKESELQFLKAIPYPPHTILTTAFPDYALESYEFNVVDYLLKPSSFQHFVKAVSKVPVKKTSAIFFSFGKRLGLPKRVFHQIRR